MSGDSDENQKKFIVFLDSLGPADVDKTDFIKNECFDGDYDAGTPYVTPKVLGEIYTGENPAVHGLPSVSRYEQPSRLRPTRITSPEVAAVDETYENVCQFGLPFICPQQVIPSGNYWHSSDAMGQSAISPAEANPHLTITGPAGDLSHPDEDPDVLFNLRVDYTRQLFGAARSAAEAFDFDVMFISYRLLDSYCHYRYVDPEGESMTYRDLLLTQSVDEEIRDLAQHGEVFVFGDHGATEMDEVFRINHWLRDEGYLSFEIDDDFIEKGRTYGVLGDSGDMPGEVYQAGNPGVVIDEENSVAIGADPFSTGLTLLDGATDDKVAELIDDLMATGKFDDVVVSADEWDGPYLNECPELYPARKEGIFVSGNMADELGGPEITRSGVHARRGAFGATTDIDVPDEVVPTDLFDMQMDFLGIDPEPILDRNLEFGAPPDENATQQAAEQQGVRDHLRDLGYI